MNVKQRLLCQVVLGFAALLLLSENAIAGNGNETYHHPNQSLGSKGPGSFQTGPSSGDPVDLAQGFLEQNRQHLNLSESDLSDVAVASAHKSEDIGTTYVTLSQRFNEIEIFNAQANINIARDGSIINGHANFYSHLDRIISGQVVLSEIEAFSAALKQLGLEASAALTVLSSSSSANRAAVLSRGGIASRDVRVALIYQPLSAKKIRLAWNVQLELKDGSHYYNLAIDAETGELLYKGDFMVSEAYEPAGSSFVGPEPKPSPAPRIVGGKSKISAKLTPDQYEVYEIPKEYPNDGPRTVVVNPADATYSPFGWHDTNGSAGAEFTITRGNNANAYADRDNNNAPDAGSQPDGGVSLDFTGGLVALDLNQEPSTYIPAAVTNLFYWNNIIHDVTATHGFTEASGNFQAFNYSGNGLGNDYVLAEAQDGAIGGNRNNANFGTPDDGQNPRMQMYLWTTASPPERDGDLSSMIIAHEYGHGVSNRLTGGPSNTNCLDNDEQMGEGWSDWLGLVLTANGTDTPTTLRGVGTYALSQPPEGAGIRAAPYSTDFAVNGWTYDDIKNTSGPHPLGHIWASIIWEVYWELVNEHGFNPDIYGDWTTGGNNLALRLILDGMKLQPCSPGFVDGRDAILLADQNLTGGANQCLLWAAFARRGLGYSAQQGNSNSRTDGAEAFDLPLSCELLSSTNTSAEICAGSDAVFTINLGGGFVPPINLSASGNPVGTTVGFSANPVGSAPSSVTVTVSNTGVADDGDYTINLMAADAVVSTDIDLSLAVFNTSPGTPELNLPVDKAVDTNLRPNFVWVEGLFSGCQVLSDFQGKIPDFAAGETVLSLLECLDQVNANTSGRRLLSPSSSYILEIDDDPSFGSIDSTTVTSSASGYPTVTLERLTTYYWRVRASNPCGESNDSAIWSFTTGDVPSVLLVDDDDNSPDMRPQYEALLNAAGLSGYQIWNTNGTDNEPTAEDLNGYGVVVWFSGDHFGGAAGPGTAGEAALTTYLNAGGCLFISSQDYFYDHGLTSFMTGYLGITGVSNDVSQTSANGSAGGIYEGLGPYSLTFPFSNYSDALSVGNGGVNGFDGSIGISATSKITGNYTTSFLAFPLETVPEAERVNILLAFLAHCP